MKRCTRPYNREKYPDTDELNHGWIRNKQGLNGVIRGSNRKGYSWLNHSGALAYADASDRRARYASGRVCKKQDCSTKISIYNRREYCNAHAPVNFPRVRGHIIAETGR